MLWSPLAFDATFPVILITVGRSGNSKMALRTSGCGSFGSFGCLCVRRGRLFCNCENTGHFLSLDSVYLSMTAPAWRLHYQSAILSSIRLIASRKIAPTITRATYRYIINRIEYNLFPVIRLWFVNAAVSACVRSRVNGWVNDGKGLTLRAIARRLSNRPRKNIKSIQYMIQVLKMIGAQLKTTKNRHAGYDDGWAGRILYGKECTPRSLCHCSVEP